MTFRLLVLLLVFMLGCVCAAAQSEKQLLFNVAAKPSATPAASPDPSGNNKRTSEDDSGARADAAARSSQQFRLERMQLSGGAELLTIFARLDGVNSAGDNNAEVPLISVVRDTLSDSNSENDRLRYVWMLSYTRPNLMKRLASAIPFLYQHVGNQTKASNGSPKPIIDLANAHRQMWNRFLWMGVQNIVLDSYGLPIKASTRTYRRNAKDYRAGHVLQALSILDNYEHIRSHRREEGELLAFAPPQIDIESLGASTVVDDAPKPVVGAPAGFSPGEMLELRARLILSSKTFGGLLGPERFHSTVARRLISSIDTSGHNWELLRQRAETEGLYFEPLTMPDGQATHAIIWIAKSDLAAPPDRPFQARFLNIANPWKDQRLRNWNGFSRTVYFDRDNRRVDAANPDAHAVEMIPLALYGLDHPMIPALLIDFRNGLNPKKREMSRRFFSDVAKDALSLSSLGNFPYFVGRRAYEFVTGRRGMDVNQPTRLRSYSELKLLLSFNGSIEPKLREEIERRVQNVSVNPLNNDNETEVRLARQQYDALMNYARCDDGLPAKIDRDRRAEMMPLKHGKTGRFFLNLANVLSFGRYVHREDATAEMYSRLEVARRLEYHTNFLKQVARSSPQAEVAWDIGTVKQSLQFLVADGAGASGSTAKAAAAIFERTEDADAKQLCLDALSKINNRTARAELLGIYERESQAELRAQIGERLRKAIGSDPRIKPSETRTVLNQLGQP